MFRTIQEISQMAGTHMERTINLSEAEKYFEEIFNKVLNNTPISHDEEVYIDKFMHYLYPLVGGELYPFPRYDEKLKDIYQKASDYYLSHLNKNTEGSIVFLWYFQMTQMSKENNMKPRLGVGHKIFEEKPNYEAFHTTEVTGIGYFPAVYFNPKTILRCMDNKKYILFLLRNSTHELRHAMQHQLVDLVELDDPQVLIWAKEFLTRKVIGDSYYDLNYTNIFFERDARHYSGERMNKVLEGKGYKFLDVEDDSYSLDVRHKKDEKSEDMLAIDLLDAVASKSIAEDTKWLEYFPVLKNVYNMNGIKKTVPQIEAELYARFEKEIQNGLTMEDVNKKTQELLKGICATDNDLRFQYLCQEASNLYAENKTEEFNNVILEIKGLLEQRELSYEEFEKTMKNRIRELEKKEYLVLHPENGQRFDQNEYQKVSKELYSTKNLLSAAIEYNPKFKEKHNEKVMKFNIKQRLSAKIHQKIGDNYKYYATDKGYLEAVSMTEEEKNERFRDEIQALLDANTRDGVLNGSQFEIDVHDLNTYYELDGVRK